MLNLYAVTVDFNMDTAHLMIRARVQDEAMNQALESLGQTYETVNHIVVTPIKEERV